MKEMPSPPSPDTTLKDLEHQAFCALAALGLARQEGRAGTPYAETLFLAHWLATAQKQKRFPKSVAVDILWLLERGRRHGPAAGLRRHLEYLWRSAGGNLAEQSELFRLTWVTETLKNQGWKNWILSVTEWASRVQDRFFTAGNGFLVEKMALQRAFDDTGRQTAPVEFRVTGDTGMFLQTFSDVGLNASVTGKSASYDTVMLHPADALTTEQRQLAKIASRFPLTEDGDAQLLQGCLRFIKK